MAADTRADPQNAAPVYNPNSPLYRLDHVLTRAQAAAYLRISESYLKRKAAVGKGPAGYRCGKRWTYLVRDLVAWRESFRVESQVVATPPTQPAETSPVETAPATLPPQVQDEALAPPPRRRGRPRKTPPLVERGVA